MNSIRPLQRPPRLQIVPPKHSISGRDLAGVSNQRRQWGQFLPMSAFGGEADIIWLKIYALRRNFLSKLVRFEGAVINDPRRLFCTNIGQRKIHLRDRNDPVDQIRFQLVLCFKCNLFATINRSPVGVTE